MQKKPTIMLHLTKTAGGTLKSALRDCSDLKLEFLYGKDDEERIAASDLSKTDMIYGHTTFGIHSKLGLPDDTRYMCFMRHPVTRTISHYHHLRNVEKGPVGDKIRQSSDINDFFANYDHWEFSNFMMKIITGLGRSKPEEGVNVFRAAIDIIDNNFDFIGFQEYFPLSLKKLSETINADVMPQKDINVGRYSLDAVSQETINKIVSINTSDMRLYKYALKKFL